MQTEEQKMGGGLGTKLRAWHVLVLVDDNLREWGGPLEMVVLTFSPSPTILRGVSTVHKILCLMIFHLLIISQSKKQAKN